MGLPRRSSSRSRRGLRKEREDWIRSVVRRMVAVVEKGESRRGGM